MPAPILAEAPAINCERTFGGPDTDYAHCVAELEGVGHVIAGSFAPATHELAVTALISNNCDSLPATLTDGAVFMVRLTPVMEGKQALIPWLEGYLPAYQTPWA